MKMEKHEKRGSSDMSGAWTLLRVLGESFK